MAARCAAKAAAVPAAAACASHALGAAPAPGEHPCLDSLPGGESGGCAPGNAAAVGGGRRAKLAAAKAAARAKFETAHPIVFDAYGRVLRWAIEPTEMRCTKWIECVVTKSALRRFRTKEEELQQKQIRLDRQAAADGRGGNQSEEQLRKMRQAKEDRGRCALYREWLRSWAKDESKTKEPFFRKLGVNHEDFGALRALHKERSLNRRKAGALYRHVALQVHPDKLPKKCSAEAGLLDMMRAILNEADHMKNELMS